MALIVTGERPVSTRCSWKPRKSSPLTVSGEMNITPMIDVLLVLIVIFMIAQPMMQKTMDIQLPKEEKNPTDARPQLLLAWDSMNREWDGIAVRMYRIAYRADPRAKSAGSSPGAGCAR